MKKIIILTALIAAVISSNAQERLLRWGPKAGVNLSTLSDTKYGTSVDYKVGFTAGLIFEFKPIKWLSASAELLYSNRGAKIGGIENRFKEASYNMHYIDIPLMANFYVFKGLALSTGIQVSPLMGATITSKDKDGGKLQDNCRSDFKSTAISIPVSISYNFKMGLFVDARYNYSLNNLSNTYSAGGVNTRDIKINSSCFAVTVGWKF